MSNEGLQGIGKYRTAIAHHKSRGWELLTMTTDQLEKEYNGNGFNRWYKTVSLEIISGLFGILIIILISVIGYNFIKDDQAHSCAIQGIQKLEKEKIGKDELLYESALIRNDIQALCVRHDRDVDRISKKLDEAVKEIKGIVMQKYYMKD